MKNVIVKKSLYNESVKKLEAIQAIDTNKLVEKTDCNAKIKDIEDKIPDHFVYINTNTFNKFFSKLFDD